MIIEWIAAFLVLLGTILVSVKGDSRKVRFVSFIMWATGGCAFIFIYGGSKLYGAMTMNIFLLVTYLVGIWKNRK